MSNSKRVYNHKKDVLDGTEVKFGQEHNKFMATNLPSLFDLRKSNNYVSPILDQGQLGACGPNEISNALRFCIGKEQGAKLEWQPSRLYIYYFSRLLEGSPLDQDTGISIKGGIEAVAKYSACSEQIWSYDITKFTKPPPLSAIKAAHMHLKGFKGLSVLQNLVHIKQALFSGFPIVFGIQVYESFESQEVSKTGIIPMPDIKTEELKGGHCVSLFGFNDADQKFIGSNSWGEEWGEKGYFTIPYSYVLDPNLASDFWVISYFK